MNILKTLTGVGRVPRRIHRSSDQLLILERRVRVHRHVLSQWFCKKKKKNKK